MSEYLKCDAEGCDHVEEHDMVLEAHIDTPCPKCGANLLTRHDFLMFEAIKNLVQTVDDAVSSVLPPEDSDPVEMGIHYHDGKLKMEVHDAGEEGQGSK